MGQDVVGHNFVGQDVAGAKSLGQVVIGQKVLGQEVGHRYIDVNSGQPRTRVIICT